MNHTLKIVMLLAVILQVSCAAPLQKERAVSAISSDAGISPDSIRMTSYCSFVVSHDGSPLGRWKECVLATSNLGIHIYTGDIKNLNLEKSLYLDFEAMEGVDFLKFGLGGEVQITTGVALVGITLTKDRARYDLEGLGGLFHEILANGVERIESKGRIKNIEDIYVPISS